MSATATAASEPLSSTRRRGDLPRRWLLVGAAVAYLPFTFLGYGTDVHVNDVLRAGRLALEGDYEPSRAGGLPPFEVAVGVLDGVGGSLLVNLAALAFGLLALWSLHRLLELDGAPWPGLGALAVAVNPWFWMASTSLGEVVWALGLALGGAVAAGRDRRLLAGALFGLAAGCRPAAAVVAAAWLVAEQTGAASTPVPWRSTLRTALVAVGVALACFVPAWLDAGRTLDFVDPGLDADGWGVELGRFLVKNVATATILGTIVLLVGVRHFVAAVGRWRRSPMVRFAIVTIVLAEALFLAFPDKPVHLLPVVAAVALLAGAAPPADRRWLVALVVAQLVSAVVGSTIAAPDDADGRDSGRIALRPADGILVNDIRCRLHDIDRGTWIRGDTLAERFESEARADANWHCQRDAWRDS
jgi:hypothetical protein